MVLGNLWKILLGFSIFTVLSPLRCPQLYNKMQQIGSKGDYGSMESEWMWRAELPVALRRTPPRSTNKASHDKQSLICLPWIDLCAEATGGRTAQSLGLVDSTPNTNTIPRLQQTTASSARPVRSGKATGLVDSTPSGASGLRSFQELQLLSAPPCQILAELRRPTTAATFNSNGLVRRIHQQV